jgi:thiamine biosynthesis protein ThiC
MNAEESQFLYAISINNLEKVKKLLLNNELNINVRNNYGLNNATSKGFFEIIELLLKNHKFDNISANECILLAAKKGHFNLIKLFIEKRVITTSTKNDIIRFCSQNGNLYIINFMLKQKNVNPSYKKNISIMYAFQNNYSDIVNLLWSFKEVKDTLQKDYNELFEILKKQDLKLKIGNF